MMELLTEYSKDVFKDGYDSGYDSGAQTREKNIYARVNALKTILLPAGKFDEYVRASSDPVYAQELARQYFPDGVPGVVAELRKRSKLKARG